MIKALLPICVFIFGIFTSSCYVLAQTTYAVVVGISDYANFGPQNGDLHFADDDARLFAELLMSREGGSISPNNIILLTERNATRANILRALSLFQQATSRDRVIFYFSGHGDQSYLLPYDARPGVVLFHNEVKKAFRQSAAQTKVLLADACKSGNIRRRTYTQAPSTTSSDVNKNVIVIMSSRANQLSQELGRLRHGVFTYFLVRGAAKEADENRDRIVTMQELYKYMRQMIMRMTQNQQTPVVFGRFPASLPFTRLSQ
ncbi:caspase family protein [Fibrisoma montanum]|nr:caspase family protein [Fibrisoma montanum]